MFSLLYGVLGFEEATKQQKKLIIIFCSSNATECVSAKRLKLKKYWKSNSWYWLHRLASMSTVASRSMETGKKPWANNKCQAWTRVHCEFISAKVDKEMENNVKEWMYDIRCVYRFSIGTRLVNYEKWQRQKNDFSSLMFARSHIFGHSSECTANT